MPSRGNPTLQIRLSADLRKKLVDTVKHEESIGVQTPGLGAAQFVRRLICREMGEPLPEDDKLGSGVMTQDLVEAIDIFWHEPWRWEDPEVYESALRAFHLLGQALYAHGSIHRTYPASLLGVATAALTRARFLGVVESPALARPLSEEYGEAVLRAPNGTLVLAAAKPRASEMRILWPGQDYRDPDAGWSAVSTPR